MPNNPKDPFKLGGITPPSQNSPSDPFGVRGKSFDETIPGQIVNFFAAVPESTYNVGKSLVQSLFRIPAEFGMTAAQAGLGIADKALGTDNALKANKEIPTDGLSTFLGPDPLEGYGTKIERLASTIETSKFAQRLGLDKHAMPLAFAGIVGGEALNFAGGEENAVKTSAKKLIADGDFAGVLKLVRDNITEADWAKGGAKTTAQRLGLSNEFDTAFSNETARMYKEGGQVLPGAADTPAVPNITPEEHKYMQIIQDQYNGADNVLSADSAKSVYPEYNGANSELFHKDSSDFVKSIYPKWLEERAGTKNNTVLFTGGGTGSGKTTALLKNGIDIKDYPIVYDGNFSSEAAIGRVKKALDAGYDVQIVFVHRDPVEAFTNGVIPRVKTQGRVVPIAQHIDRHELSLPNVEKAAKDLAHYGDRAEVIAIDNTRGRGNAQAVPTLADLPKFSYNKTDLQGQLYAETERAAKEGRLTPEQAAAIKGEKIPQADGQGVGRQPQQERSSEQVAAQEAAIAEQEARARNPIANLVGVDPATIGRSLTPQEIQTVAAAKSIDEVAAVLRAAGYDDAIVKRFSPELLGMNEAEIADAMQTIRGVDSMQKVTAATEGMTKLQNTPTDAVINLAEAPDGKSWTSLLKGYLAKAKPGARAHAIDYLATPEFVLEKLGLAKPAEMLHDARDSYLTTLKKEFVRMADWQKRVSNQVKDGMVHSPGDTARLIFQYLDGKEKDVFPFMTKAEHEVAQEIRAYLKQWADRLKLPEDNRISKYITHIFERQTGKIFDNAFEDPELAAIMNKNVASSVYDPFLQKRLGGQEYIEDVWRALDAYVKRGSRKEAMDPALAALEEAAKHLDDLSYNYVMKLSHRVNMRPTELEKAMDSFITQTPLGHYFTDRPVAYLTKAIRGMFYRGTLGLNFSSALRNLSQGANTYAKLGEKYTIIGYAKMAAKLASRNFGELYDQNILSDAFVQDLPTGILRKKMQQLDKGLFSMFDIAEKINRGSSYFGAKAKALNEGLSEEQAIKYAKRIVRETQFAFGAVDTPVALNDDVVKTLTQLQSYNIKQIEFLARMVKNKEFGGLIRYTASALGFVYTIGRLFGMTPAQLIPSIGFGGAPLTSTLGAAAGSFSSNEQTQATARNQLNRNVISLLPAGAQMKKSIEGAQAYVKGKDTTPTGKFRFRVDQDLGTLIRVLLFGKYSLPSAQKYFDSIGKKQDAPTNGSGAFGI